MNTKKSASELLKEWVGELTFGMYLRAARLSMGVTQSQIGEKLGVTKSVICDIERGRQTVSLELAIKIAKTAGFSELLAAKLCLQDQLNRAKIKARIELLAA